MKSTAPAVQKIQMIKASIRCLTCGLLGLLPFIGVIFALVAGYASFSARRQERFFWNPAKPHRIVGLICASLGALVWSCVDTILIYHALNSYIWS
jgi:hypothetical protein